MSLHIFHEQRQVGRLWLDERRRMVFAYEQEWLASGFQISASLPLREAPYEDDTARPFFSNLLPEGDLREALTRKLGISRENDYALLESIGGDCAGALTLLPEGAVPQEAGQGYKKVSESGLEQLLASLPARPFLAGEEGYRLSLAGAQDKLPVRFLKGKILLPQNGAPSSHILKISMERFPDIAWNELFCLSLAKRVGLSAADAQVVRVKTRTLLLVTRYDRVEEASGKVIRLHQEDFNQALGLPPSTKYESEGGPSLADCFSVVTRQCCVPAKDRKELLDRVLFNFLVGNADAHGKNFSLVYRHDLQGASEGKGELAPAYDLICTAMYPDLAATMAMGIGGEKRPDWVMPRHFARFAEAIGIRPRVVHAALDQLAQKVEASAPLLATELTAAGCPKETVARIRTVLRQRIKYAQRTEQGDNPQA